MGSDYHFRFDTRFFAKNFVTLAIASVIVHEMVPGFEMLNRVDIALHVLLALVLYLLLFLILNFHDLREIKQTLIRG
mgnify:FL=1